MSNPLSIPLVVMSGWRTTARPAHEGIDLTAPVGTPVYAVKDGWVKLTTGNTGDAGNSIIVQHTADDETRYNHLQSRPDFKNDAPIKARQLIGHVGMTGKTTAPHLHFARYRLGKSGWKDVDPRTLLDFSTTTGGSSTTFDPEEDDMFTDEDRNRLNAVYAALFGARNLTGKADQVSWENIDGSVQKANYGVLPIVIHNQELIAKLISKP